ncbi:OmpA family protein [Tabrizicola sp.]|uniref:OmpA family protein n=1 Tax=Tabrizicola sp. TaxID=2005166 RepID=UPI003F2C44AD
MRTVLTSLAICASLLPVPGAAQELSEEELLKLFVAQRDAYNAALEGNTSLTRGLTLITADDVEIATEVPKDDAAAAKTAGTEVATVEPAGDPTAPTETRVSTNDTATLVKMPAELGVNVRIEFAFDSAALDEAQKPKLQKLCNVMKMADIELFRIIGHTDASGSDGYNERLSRLRAEEVQRYFVNDCGIAANRLEAVGLGERFLLEDYDADSDQNRRVEFQALS